jgi:hypothetical protein
MTFSRLLLSTAAALLLALPGCAAADANEDTSASADELTLAELAVPKGAIAKGGRITVGYNPSDYDPGSKLPFIAVELLPTAAAGGVNVAPTNVTGQNEQLVVRVNGEFPGSPRVLVVNEKFRVLAATNGAPVTGGVAASLSIPVASTKRFVLVRDDRWVRPMQFDVSLAEQ